MHPAPTMVSVLYYGKLKSSKKHFCSPLGKTGTGNLRELVQPQSYISFLKIF